MLGLWQIYKVNTVKNCCVDYHIKFSNNTMKNLNVEKPRGKDAIIVETRDHVMDNQTALFPLLITLDDSS